MIYNILCYITPPYYSTPCGYISAVFACYIANSHSGTRIQVTEAAAAAHDSVDSEVTDSEVCHCASGSGPGKPRLGPADEINVYLTRNLNLKLTQVAASENHLMMILGGFPTVTV